MADSDRVVYPDEVDDVKEKAAKVDNEAGDENTVEEKAEGPPPVGIAARNMITVPANCPEGYKMGIDGVCREVFD